MLWCWFVSDLSGQPASQPVSDTADTDTYQHLVEGTTTHAIFMIDPDGNITTWSPAAHELYGYTSGAVDQQPLTILFSDETSGDQSLDTLLTDAKEAAIETRGWHQQADDSVFWAHMTISPLWNDDFHGYAVVSKDMTEKHEYEQMLERQNDRLKEFADILAHDLRNPLQLVDGRNELARETGADEHFEVIEQTIDRMERLIDDLLKIAHQGEVVTDPAPTDIEAVIDTAWEGAIGTNTEATLQYNSVGTVAADTDRLCELFENLFRNASEHGGEDVSVTVGPLPDGMYIADDGPGIPQDQRGEVFEHGVSTDDDGSGYGLSIVRTIARAHGWDAEMTEGETGGARIEITGIQFLD
jgi:PAS domain S-box-containing protein